MITVREYGTSGLVVLLLNGTGGALAHLERLAERLAPTYRVLVPVFPGYADTPRHDGAYSFELDCSLLREALAARGACRIHAAIGHSFGASRAVALALAEGFAVERIVGLGPALIVTPEERAGLMTLAGMLRQGVPLPLEAIVIGQLSNGWRAAHPKPRSNSVNGSRPPIRMPSPTSWRWSAATSPSTPNTLLVRPAARVSKLLFRVGSADFSLPPSASADSPNALGPTSRLSRELRTCSSSRTSRQPPLPSHAPSRSRRSPRGLTVPSARTLSARDRRRLDEVRAELKTVHLASGPFRADFTADAQDLLGTEVVVATGIRQSPVTRFELPFFRVEGRRGPWRSLAEAFVQNGPGAGAPMTRTP